MSSTKKNNGLRPDLLKELDCYTPGSRPPGSRSPQSRPSLLQSLSTWRPLLAVSLSFCLLVGPAGLNLGDAAVLAATPAKKKTSPASKPAKPANPAGSPAGSSTPLVPPPFSSSPAAASTTPPAEGATSSQPSTSATTESLTPQASSSSTSTTDTPGSPATGTAPATAGDAAAAGSLTSEPEKPKEKTSKRSSRSRSSRSKSKSEDTATTTDSSDSSSKKADETKPAAPANPTDPTQSQPIGDAAKPGETPGSESTAKTESEKKTTSRSRRSKESKSKTTTETAPDADSSNPSSQSASTETATETKPESKSKRSKKSKSESETASEDKPQTKASSKRSKGKKKGDDTTDGTSTEAAELKPSEKKSDEVETPTADRTPEVAPPTTTTGSATPAAKPEAEQPTATESGDKVGGDTEEVIKPRKRVTEADPLESDEIAPAKRKRASSLTEADELMLKGKFEAAEDAYRALIPEDQEGDAYAGLAVALAKQNLPKKVLEAEKIMKKGKEQFADNPNMIAAAAHVSYVHSKTVASPARRDLYLEAAETLSKRAVKASPDAVIALQTLGLVKLAQDDPESAIAPLKKAARLAEDAYTNTLLAEAMLKVDPHDENAKALIDEALGLDSKYHPARLQKAIYLTAKGKHEEAFTELHTIPRDQRGADWQRVQGDIYKAQGDGPSALASWKEANRLDPRSPEPYKNLAHHYSSRGDGEMAIAEMHNALEILPNDLNLRRELAELALRQDKLEVAETEYRTILSVKDSDPAALLGLSRVYFRKARKDGQYPPDWAELMDKVTRIVTEQNVSGQVVKKGVKNLTEKIQLSEAEKALSEQPPRFREARQLFLAVITTHKDEPYELLSLGEQACNDGDLKSAEEAFGYAKEINEVAPRAEQGISKIVNLRNEAKRHTELANATWKLPEIAIDHYRQALIADPQHPDAYYGLYKLYYRLKKDDKKAVDYAHTYLEASDDNDPLRKEVEDDLSRMNKRLQK